MKWQVQPKAPGAFLKQFPEYSPLIIQLLYSRGLKTQESIDEFFHPDFHQDFHDPYLLKGMKEAVKRISKAIEEKEKITVYGDFDTDGVCASVILYSTLKKLGCKSLDTYIPNREKENHGLNENSVRELARKGVKLIVTVDCGSTDFEEVKLANSLGLDVIITDHHEVHDKLPKALALVNPLQKEDKYPFKKLSGAGVAYKLSWALLDLKNGKKEPFKKWLLDLVAIATVVDMMPIIGENRTMVRYGLGVLAQTERPGLKELMKTARVEPKVIQRSTDGEAPITNLNATTLGFVIGPRLNAASRMDHANAAFHLLTTQNRKEANRLAMALNQKNTRRQNLTLKIVQELESRLNPPLKGKAIFEGSPDWPVGLVGLVANKVREKYCRPAVIYHEKGDLIHASCRSIPQFDLMGPIKKAAKFLDDYGGHRGGAGFRVKKENLKKVKDIFIKEAEKKLKAEDLISTVKIDAQLTLNDINWSNYDQIQKFAPFGRGNSEPRFLIKGLEVKDLRVVGNNGGHLKLDLICFDGSKAKNFKAIAFGMGEKEGGLKKGDLIDIVFEFILNEWNGSRDLELKIIDLKLTD